MWPFKKNHLVNLGSETDDDRYNTLVNEIIRRGGTRSSEQTDHVGGQEILSDIFEMRGAKLIVTRETYEGLSLEGPKEIVQEIEGSLK